MPPKKKAKPGDRVRRCKALIWGPEGAGKTHYLGTAAFDERTCPMAILDLEGGVLDVLETHPGWGTDLIHIPLYGFKEYNESYERLRVNDEGFKSFGIDSISETHIMALFNILDTKGLTRKEPDLIQQDDYGIALTQMRRLVREFRDLPLHGFYTAHAKDELDPRLGKIKVVKLPGQAATEIPGLMTVSAYLGQDTETNGDGESVVVRALLLKNYPKIRTKIRAPWGMEDIPDEIEDPTVTKLLDALQYSE